MLPALILGIWSSFWSRLEGAGAGSSIWPDRPPQLSAALFALPIALTGLFTIIGHALHHLIGWPLAFCIMWACAWGWMQTGHVTAYRMGTQPEIALSGKRREPLSDIIDPICEKMGWPLGGAAYCWLFMGVKGFLIHLPLGLWALPAALFWPFSYWLGVKIPYDGLDELLAGFLSGALCAAVLL